MHLLISELQRLASDAIQVGAHMHLTNPLRLAVGAVINEMRKMVKAAGGPRVVLKQALHMLEERVEQGDRAWPQILREAADLVEHAQEVEAQHEDKQPPSKG